MDVYELRARYLWLRRRGLLDGLRDQIAMKRLGALFRHDLGTYRDLKPVAEALDVVAAVRDWVRGKR